MLSKLVLALSLTSITGVVAQTAVSQTVFDQISRYTRFAGAAYAEDCPSPPFGSTILNFFNNTATDTQAFIFRDATAREIILSFRGSGTPVDLDTDLLFQLATLSVPGTSCTTCKVHAGFQNAYNTIASAVSSAVGTALSNNAGYALVVTGHSLGGGLASLASASLAASGRTVTTYTFGEPRNGDSGYTTYINRLVPNYFRVTHANDGVPQIPPTLLGFQHHGTEYWERSATGNTAATTFQCPGVEPTTCNAAQDYGAGPINGAHIQYTNILIAAALFNPACGYSV